MPSRRALILGGLAMLPDRALAARGQVVAILGDSLTVGAGLPPAATLPPQLHLALERLGVPNLVRGAGVSGDTTARGLTRMDAAIPPETAVVVVALGGEDLLLKIDPDTVRANLDAILRRLKARHKGVVLAGIAAPPQLGAYAVAFNAVFPRLARAHGVALYPDLLAGVARNGAASQGEGLHPNARAMRIIADRLAPVVARVLRQQR
jgi:acyl-CoA thioesterase-1